ncbi:uncharacterized protein LOC125076320 [Vanessa atalanta]|uniref:uncharacterized protein LOC125076320 n=1 Tax=Vanessa atalanta TaxID=42275 RepID=UPI001FCCE428|nr:uncharacterized protein LOC125076320 [Vanessa atalanta]
MVRKRNRQNDNDDINQPLAQRRKQTQESANDRNSERIEPTQSSNARTIRPSVARRQKLVTLYKLMKRSTRVMEMKINNLERELQQRNERTVESQQPASSSNIVIENTPYNILNIATEKPKFDKNKNHPVTFLEDLTAYLRKIPSKGKELDLIYECLQGETRDWARLYSPQWKSLDDFKTDFLHTYWGESEQNKIRRDIVCAKWNKVQHPTMLGHFLSLTSQVRMLSFTIPEQQLVSDMIRHYPRHIQQMWAMSKGDTVIELTDFLRNLDDINKQDDGLPPHSSKPKIIKDVSNNRERYINRNDIQHPYKNRQKQDYNKNYQRQNHQTNLIHNDYTEYENDCNGDYNNVSHYNNLN